MKIHHKPSQTSGLPRLEIVGPATDTYAAAKQALDSIEFIGEPANLVAQTRRLQKRLDQEKASGQFLDPAFQPLIETARDFLAQQYRARGLALPGIFICSGGPPVPPGRSSGIGNGLARGIQFGAGIEVEPLEIISLCVHELSHAAGYARFSPRGNIPVFSSTTGWVLQRRDDYEYPDSRFAPMFRAFEEGVAYYLETLAWTAFGGTVNNTYHLSKSAPANTDQEIRLFAVLAELKDPINNAGLIEKVYAKTQEGRYFAAEAHHLEFDFGYLVQERHTPNSRICKSVYCALPDAFNLLAQEAYPDRLAPYEAFMEDLIRAQVTGNKKPVLSRLKTVYGSDGLRFLALLEPRDRTGYWEGSYNYSFDTALLTAFARAGTLPADRKQILRQEIIQLLYEDRGPTLSWTRPHDRAKQRQTLWSRSKEALGRFFT